MPATLFPRSAQRGLTLVECCVVTGILAIVAGTAVPSFSLLAEKQHIEGIAAQFETDVHFARAAADLRSESVRLSFHPAGGATCYLVHTGDAADCSCDAAGHAQCEASAQLLRSAFVPAGERVQLSSRAGSMVFSAVRHTVSPANTVTVTGRASGRSLQQVVNIMGRVRSCSPDGTLPGHRSCGAS